MRLISESEFHKLRKFVEGAANYADGGSVRHSVDGEEDYRVIRNGRPETVLSCFGDDKDGMVYKVDDSVWGAWRRKVGPVL